MNGDPQFEQEQPQPPQEPAKDQPKEEPKFTAGDSLIDVAKRLLFIADEAGEPEVAQGTDHSIVLHYPGDDSLVTIRFEARSGQWGAVAAAAVVDEEQNKTRNERVSELKKGAEEQRKAYQETKAARAQPAEEAHA